MSLLINKSIKKFHNGQTQIIRYGKKRIQRMVSYERSCFKERKKKRDLNIAPTDYEIGDDHSRKIQQSNVELIDCKRRRSIFLM